MVAVVGQVKPGKLVLEQLDGLGPIQHPGIVGEIEPVVEATDQIEPEGMEGADPHGSSGLGIVPGDAFSHLTRRLVGKGEEQDPPRIDAVREQALDASHQGLGLSGSRSGLEQIRVAPMGGRRALTLVERPAHSLGLRRKRSHMGKKQGIKQLLRDHLERSTELQGDVGGAHAILDEQRPSDPAGEEELPREQIHLDLAALTPAIVGQPLVETSGNRLRGAGRIDGVDHDLVRIVAEDDVTDLVGDEEGLLEGRASVLVDDEPVFGVEGGPSAVEHMATGRAGVDPQSLVSRLGECERVGIPGIASSREGCGVERRGGLATDLTGVHVMPPRPAGTRARPRGHAPRPISARS